MPCVSPADTALLFGYVLALPFTLFVPGFLRLWRRREVEVLLTTQAGLAVVTTAWMARGSVPLAVVHAGLLVALTVTWVRASSARTAQA